MKYSLLPIKDSSFGYICDLCKKETQNYIVVDDEHVHFMAAVGTNKRFPTIMAMMCSEECFNLWLLQQ